MVSGRFHWRLLDVIDGLAILVLSVKLVERTYTQDVQAKLPIRCL